ncbi:hypothetical protein [Helicobacter phage PtB89G]|nr:hypothetical protein [Helicobacter phage PtB89G]MCQ2719875.1 hypothetical protein [Helicobacter pylori]
MRQEHETAKSFNQIKEITQAIMLKKDAQANATHQATERTQEANNTNAKAHTQEPTQTRAKTSFKTKASHNANAFKTEQGLNSSLRAKPSDEALKQGLATQESN